MILFIPGGGKNERGPVHVIFEIPLPVRSERLYNCNLYT